MEELLEPWVHFIPLQPDFSDVEEKVQWMLDHDAQAQQIVFSGAVWMRELMDPVQEAAIQVEMLRRYRAHFV